MIKKQLHNIRFISKTHLFLASVPFLLLTIVAAFNALWCGGSDGDVMIREQLLCFLQNPIFIKCVIFEMKSECFFWLYSFCGEVEGILLGMMFDWVWKWSVEIDRYFLGWVERFFELNDWLRVLLNCRV